MRKSQPTAKSSAPSAAAQPVVARRKNPWLLGLAVLLLTGWMLFLAAMALRG